MCLHMCGGAGVSKKHCWKPKFKGKRICLYGGGSSTTPVPTTLKHVPTKSPTNAPTKIPTNAPTKGPTNAPTKSPTDVPTMSPTTLAPSYSPTNTPTGSPSDDPSLSPSMTSEYVDAGQLFDSVGDSAASCQTNTPLATCKVLCDNTTDCRSFQYAAVENGFCCPKKKCGSEDEPLTYSSAWKSYYKPCTRAPSSSPTDAPTGTPSFAQVWSWTLEDSADTGEIVFLDDEQVTAVNEYINKGLELVIRSDLVLHKSRNDSTDSSFIQFIDLDDGNKIKTWRMNSGTEDYLQIDYDANSDNTIIKCRDNSGKCSPLVDGDRSVVLIKVRFNPRGGSAHNSEWWRNRFTMTGSHYAVELP